VCMCVCVCVSICVDKDQLPPLIPFPPPPYSHVPFPSFPSHFFADPNNFRVQDVHYIALLHTDRHPHFSPHSDAPQITNRPSNPNIILAIGATYTIRVTYSQGSPPASVEWRKDGVLITGPTVSTSSSETTLTLTNSGPDVRGRYNVTVFNVAGSDTFVYNVKVECELMHAWYGGGGGHHKWFAHSWHGNLVVKATEE